MLEPMLVFGREMSAEQIGEPVGAAIEAGHVNDMAAPGHPFQLVAPKPAALYDLHQFEHP